MKWVAFNHTPSHIIGNAVTSAAEVLVRRSWYLLTYRAVSVHYQSEMGQKCGDWLQIPSTREEVFSTHIMHD